MTIGFTPEELRRIKAVEPDGPELVDKIGDLREQVGDLQADLTDYKALVHELQQAMKEQQRELRAMEHAPLMVRRAIEALLKNEQAVSLVEGLPEGKVLVERLVQSLLTSSLGEGLWAAFEEMRRTLAEAARELGTIPSPSEDQKRLIFYLRQMGRADWSPNVAEHWGAMVHALHHIEALVEQALDRHMPGSLRRRWLREAYRRAVAGRLGRLGEAVPRRRSLADEVCMRVDETLHQLNLTADEAWGRVIESLSRWREAGGPAAG